MITKRRERMARAAWRSEQRRKNIVWRKLAGIKDPGVGYQGSTEYDAPAFYCPYIPIIKTSIYEP